ncbi:hypothetical protein [Longimicrobium sp.]|uniref:hypothetical protein n=1 Tax=Longimicrobium sp. TaxID=2029185 RepID=UPI002B542569|nr:hypothetical protein [Longimicrobium sp.]HSU18082.1 hypothetical protein [Longimicrobium sp.]
MPIRPSTLAAPALVLLAAGCHEIDLPGSGGGAPPDSSWTQVVSVPGLLLDASPQWALYVSDPPSYDFLHLRNVGTGEDRTVRAESNIGPGMPAWVTAAGGIVDYGLGSFAGKPRGVQEFGGSGAVSDPGFGPLARGRWAAWRGRLDFSPAFQLHRDDVLGPTLVSTPAALAVESFDLADDGTIAFAAGTYTADGSCACDHTQLYVWSGGAPTQLTTDAGVAVRGPVTDGSAILYLRETGTGTSATHRLVYRGAGGAEELLTPDLPSTGGQPAIAPRRDYQLLNGWAAFQYPDASGAFHTFVRTPSGDVHAVWPAAPAGTRFVSLGPLGQVLLSAGGTLYLSEAPHTTAVSLGTWGDIGHVKWTGGKMYVVKEGGLYRLDRP